MSENYSYWSYYIETLRRNSGDSESEKKTREFIYGLLRNESGIDFTDFDDDPARWIQWLEEDDTTDRDEIIRRHHSWWNGLSEDERKRFDRFRL